MVWGIIALVVSAVVGGLSYKAAKDAQKEAKRLQDEMSGVLVNKDSNIEPIPVIYGERRIGGTRVYVHTEGGTDVPNLYLYMAIVLCEGPVEDIYDIEIDDYAIDEGRYGTIEEINSTNPDRRIFRSVAGVHTNWVYIECMRGQDNQPASSILSGASNWGVNHKLSGVAYLAVRLQWDPDKFSGIPNITAVVKGRKVYDPRTDTTAWSDNPALCIRDYLINTRYGKGLPTAAINSTAFEDAADDLDNFTVTPYSGGPTGVKLFKCNAIINTGDEVFKNLGDMLLGCKGFLPYQNGQYGLYIDQSVATSVMTLDTSTIIGGIAIKSERKEDKFNRVVCKFPNPETKWEPDQAIWPDSGSTEETTFLSEDGDEILVEEIDLNTTTSYYAARDFARIFCLRSRNALRVGLQATSEALNLRIGDRVSITHPTPGWTAKPFQVEEVGLRYDGTVDLQLVEYDSTIYAYDPASEEQTYSDTDLPDPFTVAAPAAVSATAGVNLAPDGTQIPYINISFTGSNDRFVHKYVLNVVPSVLDPYEITINTDNLTDDQISRTDPITYLIQPALVDTYTIKLRAHNSAGVRSAEVTTTVVVSGDTTPPTMPTDLAASGGLKQIKVSWTNPSEADYAYTIIYRNTVPGLGFLPIATVSGGRGQKSIFVDQPLSDDETLYYKIRVVDFSGNGLTETAAGPVSATTDSASAAVFTPRVVHGYVYYQTASSSQPTTPSATDYDFNAAGGNDPFADPLGGPSTLTSGWSINPPEQDGSDGTYWASRFRVAESTYNGTQSFSFSTPFTSFSFDGLVTFTNLNNELSDIDNQNNFTQIDGGYIQTGIIDLANDAGMAIRQGKTSYSDNTAGFWLGNDGGTPRFILGDSNNYLRWSGTTLRANGIQIRDTSGNIVFDTNEFDGTYIENATIETLKLQGEAVTIPNFATASITGKSLNTTPYDAVSLSTTLSNVGQNTRLIIFGVITCSAATGPKGMNLSIYTGSTPHVQVGFYYESNSISVPIIGSYVVSDNTTNTASLRIATNSGTISGMTIQSKLTVMAAKR